MLTMSCSSTLGLEVATSGVFFFIGGFGRISFTRLAGAPVDFNAVWLVLAIEKTIRR
jgi:hypothetical protein